MPAIFGTVAPMEQATGIEISHGVFGSGLPSDSLTRHLTGLPGVQRVPSPKLTLFLHRNFLDPQTCAAVVSMIDAVRRPSTISDPNGDAAFRTSETCDLDPLDPVTVDVETRIAALTGLAPVYGEPIQGQRYAVGQ